MIHRVVDHIDGSMGQADYRYCYGSYGLEGRAILLLLRSFDSYEDMDLGAWMLHELHGGSWDRLHVGMPGLVNV